MTAPIILIAGPTAVGKTAAVVEICKHINGEVISTDSMQIYKYMDIGTAKPTADEKQGITHHMIDIIKPDVDFNVAKYQKLAISKIEDIRSRGKVPVLCGGTGLYVDSIMYNIDFTKAIVNNRLRENLKAIADTHGNEYLHAELRKIDPISAENIHYNNVKRVIRAIEIFKTTGKGLHENKVNFRNKDYRYKVIKIGIDADRQLLYKRIEKRVDIMLEIGLEAEVKSLADMGYHKDLLSMQGLGYKEMIMYFNNIITLDEAIQKIKQGSRRYAKRQMTWFNREENVHWYTRHEFNDNTIFLSQILEHFEKSYEF